MQDSTPSPTAYPIQFEGKGMEYFKIWIVNIALTILTLGIYSAWAKVRNKQYFYGSTKIKGQSFQYHATGGQILKGRLIAAAAFVAYSIVGSLDVMLELGFMLVFLIALPWLINSGLRFNARMSSWRNVRFDFQGSYGRAFVVFFLWPLLATLTFGLLAPRAAHRLYEYIVKHHKYGDQPFEFMATPGDYGRVIYGLMILLVLFFIAIVLMFSRIEPMDIMNSSDPRFWMFPILIMAIYFGFFIISLSLKAIFFNIYWRNTCLQGNRFRASMSPARYIWVFISNSIAVGLSFGLLLAWSKVRMARFKADSLKVIEVNCFDSIQAEQQEKSNALGEEMGEMFDVDVGFGV